jgi:predicted RNase H-like HicB family nuclease
MATRFYPAIIEPAKGGFSVYFPDLPGCTSGGDSLDEAADNAIRALALHLAGLIEDKEAIPPPSRPMRRRVPKGATLVMVPADLPGRVVRVNITMDEGTLALADRIAAAHGTTRSGLLGELVRRAAARSKSAAAD